MKAHKVPATYLSGWEIPTLKDRIYVFYKNQTAQNGIVKRFRDVDRITTEHSYFMEEDFYYIDFSIDGIEYKLEKEINAFFNLNQYTITCEDDLAVVADGESRPIVTINSHETYQKYKDNNFAGDKKLAIRRMMRELPYVQFELDSKEFHDFDFIPVGVKARDGSYHNITNYPLFSDSFHEVMIMSPFLSNGIIKDFNNRNPYINHSEYMLITRAMSLNRLKAADCSNFKIYTLKDAVVDGESLISEENATVLQQDIHAKVYMVRKYSDVDLYLGSLNASHNAIHGNVEFMIRLRSKNRYLNLERLSEQIFCGPVDAASNPFQQVTLAQGTTDTEAEVIENLLDGVIKELARNNPHADIIDCGDTFDAHVHIGIFQTPYQIQISPLLSNKRADLSEEVVFAGLSLTQLSEFYKVTVSDGNTSITRVLMIPTTNMPDDREKAIVSGVISDKHCFYQYIAFLLGDDHMLSSLESIELQKEGGSRSRSTGYQLPPLYEKMLQTAATNPAKLKEIDYLLKTVSADGVIPEHFEKLYDTFRKVVKLDD